MAKHSKYKNTGILFELLVRQVTNDTLSGVKNPAAIQIIREFFKKNTALKRELGLYQTLLNEKFSTESKANAFISAVLKEHGKLNSSTLRRQKYNLIKEIKKTYTLEDFFAQKVNNYLHNASVYCLFEGKLTPAKQVKYRYNLVESILSKGRKLEESHDIYQKQDKDIRLLSYKILLEKFNKKWGKSLSKEQKSMLREYINNISNTSKLKQYLHKEITHTAKNLAVLTKKVDNKIVKIKLMEVISQLRNIKNDSQIRDKYIVSVLRGYDLIGELKNVVK
tara:strand:+ start:31 stop:867 length:837 start_codon:yes stop_codon:yes gene_type:complete